MTTHEIRTYAPTAEEQAEIQAQNHAKIALLASRLNVQRRRGRNNEKRNQNLRNIQRKMLNLIEHEQINAVGRSRRYKNQ